MRSSPRFEGRTQSNYSGAQDRRLIISAPRSLHIFKSSSSGDGSHVVSVSSSAESPHEQPIARAWTEQIGITTEQAEWLNYKKEVDLPNNSFESLEEFDFDSSSEDTFDLIL